MSNTWASLCNRLIAQASASKAPLIGQFELTARCNLTCKMCYVRKPADDKAAKESELTAVQWLRIAEEARNAGMLYLLLSGGEVFLRSDFEYIYEKLAYMGFNIVIYTNASLVTESIASKLARIPPSLIEVTMYGATTESYRKLCGDSEAYAKTVQGIDRLLSEGITLKLKTIMTRSTIPDFEQIADFAEKRGLSLDIVKYLSPVRDIKKYGIIEPAYSMTEPEECQTQHSGAYSERLTPEEVFAFQERVKAYYGEYDKEVSDETCITKEQKISGASSAGQGKGQTVQDIQPISDSGASPDGKSEKQTVQDMQQVCDSGSSPAHRSVFPCPAGSCSFWVTWDGRMTPCPLMGNPAARPLETGFHRAWKELQTLCSSIPECKTCIHCSSRDNCLTCPARLAAETNRFDIPAPYLCGLAGKKTVKQLVQLI